MTDQDHLLPLLPLRDVVVYPHMVLPLFVGRERSMEALEHAMQDNKQGKESKVENGFFSRR